jgi:hypothetical protein
VQRRERRKGSASDIEGAGDVSQANARYGMENSHAE